MPDNDQIPLLSAHDFANLHLRHTLEHPPDHVLFPFLHGLEGDNHAQNTFFASSSFSGSGTGSKYNNYNHIGYHGHNDNYRIVPKVPEYRGLVWVACEEDLEHAGDYTTLRILRRKPALTPLEQQQLDEEMNADVLGTPGCVAGASNAGIGVVSDSSSSEGLSDESSSYEDDEDLELDEDEQEMLLMIEADQAAVHAAAMREAGGSDGSSPNAVPDANTQHLNGKPPKSDTITNGLNPLSSANGNKNAPGLELDDDDDDDSLLASPVQIPIPMGMAMQVDTVHVVQSGEGEGGEDEEHGVNVETAADETGSALLNGVAAKGKKDEKHFEGAHMHPVAHRPVPGGVSSATTITPNTITPDFATNDINPHTTHPVGLGINTNTSVNAINPNYLSVVQDPTLISPLSPSSAASSTSVSSSPSTSPVVSSPGSAVPSSPGSAIGDADLTTEAQRLESPAQDPELAKEVKLQEQQQQAQQSTKRKRTDPTAPPLFTSTFRPKELLRRSRGTKLRLDLRGLGSNNNEANKPKPFKLNTSWNIGSFSSSRSDGVEPGTTLEEEEGWEFVPARVPDGISLRNFGIQVPIYATLSDIVVYSPYGATPAAKALARRFKAAIKAKRAERLQDAGLGMDLEGQEHLEEDDSNDDDVDSPSGDPEQDAAVARAKADARKEREQRKIEMAQLREAQSHFLKYEVYVLDAGEEDMRNALPHLMMRVCGAGVPGGLGLGVNANKESERRNKEEKVVDMDVDDIVGEMDMGGAVDAMDIDLNVEVGSSSTNEPKADEGGERNTKEAKEEEDDPIFIPNTVDFALREREEMRDLTKASEIISLRPTPLPTSSNPATSYTSPIPSVGAGTNIWSHTPLITPAAASATSLLSAAAFENSPAPKVTPSSELDNELGQAPYDPRIGQLYLGNSGDVPLAPDVASHFRNAASLPRSDNSGATSDEDEDWDWESMTSHLRGVEGLLEECGVDEKELLTQETAKKGKPLADDDPFNYLPTNDPASGFGYDICVECHDLAPFPSPSHLRAAEEHMAMLDTLWRERWDKMLAAKRKKQGKLPQNQVPSQQQIYPPRPPPHANAAIHLPFPSSPSNSQATMVSLMPVIRFLEKWIQPLPVPIVQPPPIPSPLRMPSPVEAPRPVTPPELKNLMMISNVDPKRNMAGAVSAAPNPPSFTTNSSGSSSSRRWSSVTALMPSFPLFPGSASVNNNSSNNNGVAATGQEKEQMSNPPPTPPPAAPLPPHPSRLRSFTSPSSSFHNPVPPTPVQARTRPLKILMYSSDGYTESSVPALCLLMAIKGLMLPEAYLELQVEKRRSFFVYQPDLGILRRVEGRLREEREREKEKERERERERERITNGQYLSSLAAAGGGSINANGKRTAPTSVPHRGSSATPSLRPPAAGYNSSGSFMGRPAAKSISFAQAPPIQGSNQTGTSINPLRLPSSQSTLVGQAPPPVGHTQFEFGSAPVNGSSALSISSSSPNIGVSQQVFGSTSTNQQQKVIKGRPRATTSPWLPSLFGGDHQSWFNDPRFDGSFPSRVLPFLYLGNLNHASNVYMLHALGITHVVSVGECALVPPPHHTMNGGPSNASAVSCHRPGPGAHFVPGKGPGGQGSLWIEEREGRIKVLDIKGVCDDGIDTLEPQLEPICDWIDKARQEGGQVLVHCRVGVSRSATVTIAYVMKHLGLPLVDAYLIVRSRRLSVLIQPNMRLLYNLCGWEIKLAKERANGNERKLKKELARALTWPYLAKEVHALNEKYLH